MSNRGAETLTDERVAGLLVAAKAERDREDGDGGEISVAACFSLYITVNELIQLLEIYEIAGT